MFGIPNRESHGWKVCAVFRTGAQLPVTESLEEATEFLIPKFSMFQARELPEAPSRAIAIGQVRMKSYLSSRKTACRVLNYHT